MEIEPVPYLREEQVRGLADALASSAGVGNVLAQGWNAYQGSAGLIRLAPGTLAAMRAGATPLTQGGWALGTLTKGGKFAAQVRWAPAAAAGVGAALATLGPALALVAVQWQLNKIGKAVERNIESGLGVGVRGLKADGRCGRLDDGSGAGAVAAALHVVGPSAGAEAVAVAHADSAWLLPGSRVGSPSAR